MWLAAEFHVNKMARGRFNDLRTDEIRRNGTERRRWMVTVKAVARLNPAAFLGFQRTFNLYEHRFK